MLELFLKIIRFKGYLFLYVLRICFDKKVALSKSKI